MMSLVLDVRGQMMVIHIDHSSPLRNLSLKLFKTNASISSEYGCRVVTCKFKFRLRFWLKMCENLQIVGCCPLIFPSQAGFELGYSGFSEVALSTGAGWRFLFNLSWFMISSCTACLETVWRPLRLQPIHTHTRINTDAQTHTHSQTGPHKLTAINELARTDTWTHIK